jgi:hypothetical protein
LSIFQVRNLKTRIMQIKNKIQPYLPHVVAIGIFMIVAFAYFYPVLEGKVLKANDSTVSKINSKEIQDYRVKNGKEPLWTNSIFSGMPAYLISTKYPGNLIKHVDTFLRMFKMPVSVLFLSMVGFYVLLLIFGFDPWLAMTGALAYGLSSFFFQILGAGHNTQAIALSYMPPVIGGIYYAYKRDVIKGALLTAFFLALEIQANHPQITYYAMLCLLVFGIVEFIYAYKNKSVIKFLKTSAILIIPFVIALGINFASLFTTWEYGKYSIRGKSDIVLNKNDNATSGLDKDYILYWSYGVDEIFNLLIPDYKGGSSKPFDRNSATVKALRQNNAPPESVNQVQRYWGTQPGTDGPHYVGAIVFFLFILGLFLVKGPEKWWLLAATLLSVMLSWGKNFMPLSDLFIDFFPGYNKFRAVTMILIIAEFCIPLLGFLALRDIFNGTTSRKEILKGLKIAAGITGGFILLVILIPGIAGSFLGSYETEYPDWLRSAIIADRKFLLRRDAFRSLIFILLSAVVILGFLFEKIRRGQAIMIIGLLIVLDLWTVDKRYLNADRFEKPAAIQKSFTPTAADAFILKDKSIYRVLNLTVSTFNDNSPTSYFHKSIGGYHGAKLKRYQEFIDTALSKNFNLIQAVGSTAKSLEEFQGVFNSTFALNMLNTKYVIYSSDAPPLVNQRALGNVWFIEKPVIVENANKEISSLNYFNPAKEALIDIEFKDQIGRSSYPVQENEKIELISYQPDELVYRYSAHDEKLAVFSEIYYPAGWKSYIDGKEVKYFRANFILRGMVLPGGDHEIKFAFEPASYITGNKISLASSVLLILILAGYALSVIFIKRKAV